MGSLPFESNACNNALGQNLILKLILEHVGATDLDDLLNCRLVSHSWNRVAVQVLEQQHDYALELDYQKMLRFKSLLWNSKMSRMNSDSRELESLRLSLSLHHKKCSEDRYTSSKVKCTEDNRSEIAASAQLLAFHPQLRLAIIDIQYQEVAEDKKSKQGQPKGASWPSLTNLELFTLFKLASAHLTSLAIVDYDEQIPLHFEKFNFTSSYFDLEFPRLSSLAYHVESFSKSEMLDLTNHVAHMIKRAPNLIKLQLNGKHEFKSTRSILESCSANVEVLDFFIREVRLVKRLSEIKFPKLKLFTASEFYWTDELNEFLKVSCPELRHIYLFLSPDFESKEDLLNLPSIKSILSFGLYSTEYSVDPRFTEYVRSIFSQVLPKLTSLESMNLDLDILFILGARFQSSGQMVPSPDQYAVFPAISTLEIQVDLDSFSTNRHMFDVLDEARSIYHHTFPNLKTLIIKHNTEEKELSDPRLATAMELFCFHPRIQHLEIHNYAQDWLDHPSILNRTFPGLKSLRLLPPPKGRAGPRLNFMEQLARFPALEFLQMGNQLASATEINTHRSLIKRFDNPLAKKYKR